ncbi:MAG: thiamine monophosphate synthase [Myxococcota bacterium]
MKLRLIAITPGDDRELMLWLMAIAPHVDAVVLREPGASALALQTLAHVVQDAGSLAIVHSKSASVSGDGVHMADHQPIPSGALVGVSCHDAAGLDRAFDSGATYAFLSPVWAPTGKPLVGRAIGVDGLAGLARGRRILGLGGVDVDRAGQLAAKGYGSAVLGGVFGADSPAAAAGVARILARQIETCWRD